MRPRTLAFPFAVLLALAPAGAAQEGGPAEVEALQKAVQQAIAQAEPSVVCVLVSRSDAYRQLDQGPVADTPGKLGRFDAEAARHHFPSRRRRDSENDQLQRYVKDLDLSDSDTTPESYGSGVVIDAAGLVLTNAHVVKNATKIFVRLPGGGGSWADVHAADPRSDLAVLRLLDRVPGLRPIKFGDGGQVRKGQFVVLLSNPFAAGFRDGSPSASWGIVSNLRRRPFGHLGEMDRAKITLHHYGTLIETDTRVNLGCSGGALLNLRGEMVGLTTAVAAVSGIDTPGGFAVPIDASMKRIVEVLRRGEEFEYGFLGVILDQTPPPGRGVHLQRVTAGSPASHAGLQADDWVVAINGQPVRENEDLFLLIGTQPAGTTVRIDTLRPKTGRRHSHTVTLAKYYVPAGCIASRRPPARGGLRVDHTSVLPQRGATPPWGPAPPEGVVIREVVPGSPADKARLQVDKVITQVNGRPVKSPAEFYEAMAKADGRATITFLNSDNQPERVTIDTH